MKILGLFIVVFTVIATNRMLGFSDRSTMVGSVIGGGTYVLLNIN